MTKKDRRTWISSGKNAIFQSTDWKKLLVRKYEVFSVLVSELTPWIKKWDDPIFYIRKEQIEKLYKVFWIDNSENRSTKIRIK